MHPRNVLLTVALLASSCVAAKPNIVFILTDDQDKHLDSMQYMDAVQKQIIDKGTSFEHHYCTTALCCPSRVSLLTGRLAHNTKVTTLNMPFGGYDKFIKEGLEDKWLAPWLQKAGYKTYYTGKLMNGHDKDNYNRPYPGGLDGHDFLIGPGTYSYLHPLFQRNREEPKRKSGYATDMLKDKSLKFIEEGHNSHDPFFLMIATVAPHSSSDKGHDDDDQGEPEAEASGAGNAPIPAPRHAHLFPHANVTRSKNYNPDKPSGASWIKKLDKMSHEREQQTDLYYRRRLQALQAVDELVGGVIKKLEDLHILDNTYVVYSTDNGFHIGQHRLNPGKRCPYEEDVNIPLAIRGPGIAKKVESRPTTHTDLVPTILKWAGASLPDNLDGVPLPVGGGAGGNGVAEHVQVEHWGNKGAEGGYKTEKNTYKALRVINPGSYSLYYAVWCDGDHELYDMSKDSQQMDNLFKDARDDHVTDQQGGVSIGGQHVGLKKLQGRLDTLLLLLKDCKGKECSEPWGRILPGKGVKTLKEALKGEHDHYFEQQNKRVKFEECTQGYQPEFEGPHF